MIKSVLEARSALGSVYRRGLSDARIKEARQDLAAAKLAQAVDRALDEGLSVKHRKEIAGMLRNGR